MTEPDTETRPERRRPGAPGAVESAPRPEPPAEAGGTLGVRLLRVLPRIVLLLVLVSIVVVFHGVLLPFALAVFLAYLLFPIIARLERGHLGSWYWRLPRWLAVILVYALLFTVGWYTVPRIVSSLASEMQQLTDQVPTVFAQIEQKQNTLYAAIGRQLEVESLSPATRTSIEKDLKALQHGTLLAPPPPAPPPEPEGTAGGAAAGAGDEAAVPPQFILFHLEIDVDGRPLPRAPEPAAPDPEEPPLVSDPEAARALLEAAALEGDGAPAVPEGAGDGQTGPAAQAEGESGVPEEEPLRFADAARAQVMTELHSAIDAILNLPGPAPAVLPDSAVELLKDLNARHLHLPPDDPGLQRFQELTKSNVQGALRQEQYVENVRQAFTASLQSARLWATEQLKKSTTVARTLVTVIFDFFLVLMLCAFFLVFFTRIRDYVADLVPPGYRDDYHAVLKRIDTRLSGAIRGQVIICLVNGILTWPGLIAIGYVFDAPRLMQFALLLSAIAAVFSLIPIFGVILSTVPMVLLALTHGMAPALAVVAWISVIHAIEAYILNPNILGHSAQMNPIIVVFALLAGKETAGLIGALLAVPIASVVVATFGYYRRRMARVYAAESGIEIPEDKWGD